MLSVRSLTSQPTSFVGGLQLRGEFPKASVVFFVATRWEMAAIRRALPPDREENVCGLRCLIGHKADWSYRLIQTGVGPERARMAATAVLQGKEISLAISSGFAGALVPAGIGDVIIGTGTMSAVYDGDWRQDAGVEATHGKSVEWARELAAQIGASTHVGLVVSMSTVVGHSVDKFAIRRLTGAVALDMESASLAAVAQERRIPFFVLRTVSDLVDEDLPLDFNAFLGPTAWSKGLYELITHPAGLFHLNRLRRHSKLAADRLTELCSLYAERGVAPMNWANRDGGLKDRDD